MTDRAALLRAIASATATADLATALAALADLLEETGEGDLARRLRARTTRWAAASKRASDEFWAAWLAHADRLGPRALAHLAATYRLPRALTTLAMRVPGVNAVMRAYVRREIEREE